MAEEHNGTPGVAETDLSYLMRRVMKLSDETKELPVQIALLGARVETLEATCKELKQASATHDQLKSLGDVVTVKIDNLHADLSTIKNALYAVVLLVLTGLAGGVFALLFKPGLQ